MSTVPGYFASELVKRARVYLEFYVRIYQNIWRIPRVYDLRDKTLSIRLIRHTAATIFIFSVLIYVLSELTSNLYASSASSLDLLIFSLSAYFFVFGLGLILYFANKIYPRRRLSFRECVALLHFLFLQLFPPLVIFMLISIENEVSYAMLDFLSFSNIMYFMLLGASMVVTFRNTMILLQLTIMQTVYFQFSILLVEFVLIVLLWSGALLLFLLPSAVQEPFFQIVNFILGILKRII